MSLTIYFDHVNGKSETVYPCRCGQTHRGDYAFEDWNHHECLHQATLVLCEEGFVLCPLCGNAWDIRNI